MGALIFNEIVALDFATYYGVDQLLAPLCTRILTTFNPLDHSVYLALISPASAILCFVAHVIYCLYYVLGAESI